MEPTITVSDLLEAYRADFLFRGCRSIKSLRSEINQLRNRIGDVPVEEVRRPMLRELQHALRADDGLAAASVNKLMAVLHASFKLAAATEHIPAVPAFPPKLRPAPPRQGFLEVDAYNAIRDELPSWARDVLDFGFYSGWRRGEVLWLTWAEVDLPARQVRLHPSRAKNSEGRPPLPLEGFGHDVMKRRFVAQVEGLEYVFHRNVNGKPSRISSTTFQLVWKDAAKAAGYPNALYHDLRRTCVRNLEAGGVSRLVAMGWVGHRTESMYRRYFIRKPEDLETAAGQMLTAIAKQEEIRILGPDIEPEPVTPRPSPPSASTSLEVSRRARHLRAHHTRRSR